MWKKEIRKTIRNVSEKFKAPLTPLNHFSLALSKSFPPPKICTIKKVFVSPQGSAGVATLTICRSDHRTTHATCRHDFALGNVWCDAKRGRIVLQCKALSKMLSLSALQKLVGEFFVFFVEGNLGGNFVEFPDPQKKGIKILNEKVGSIIVTMINFKEVIDFLVRKFVTHNTNILGSVFGRTDFLRIFIFGPPVFYADFVAGFLLLMFVGKSAQKNPAWKSLAKSSKFYTTKIPDTFLQRGRAKIFCGNFVLQTCHPQNILKFDFEASNVTSTKLFGNISNSLMGALWKLRHSTLVIHNWPK